METIAFKMCLGLPGGTVVKNPPANAGGTVRALVREDPTCHRAHALQLLSLLSRARKPQLLSPRTTTTEACAPRAHALQQEEPPQ